MRIREFRSDDVDGCLDVFDSNTPTYFRPHERADFERFLAELPGPYLVVESHSGRILACGGYARDSASTAVLTYGMVHADSQHQHIGTRLLEERLNGVRACRNVSAVIINTTQLTEGFFARFGFRTESIALNHYAPGLHGVRMVLRLGDHGEPESG